MLGAVEDLMKYLDPQFTDHLTVPDAMKLEFILAGKGQEVKLKQHKGTCETLNKSLSTESAACARNFFFSYLRLLFACSLPHLQLSSAEL